jgi:O-acetylserine/cysteine efflux transporter
MRRGGESSAYARWKGPVLLLLGRGRQAGPVPPRSAAAAAAIAVVWGVNFVVIHVGLTTTPPLLLAALRFTLVAAALAWFVPRPALAWPRLVALGLTLYAGQFGLLFTAMDVGLSPGLAAVVMQSQAVFTVLAAVVVLGERPGRPQLAGVAVATVGLVLIGLDRGGSSALGFALCLLAGLSWAAGNMVARTSGVTQGLGLVVWGSVVAAPVLAVLALVQVGPAHLAAAITGIDVAGLLALGYLTVLATVVGFGTWSALMGRYPAASVAPFTMLVPPVGLATAWLALGERPSPGAVAGSALVVGGLLLPQVGRRRRARTPARQEEPAAA